MDKFVLTPKEAAAYIGISENRIRELCAAKEIKAAKSGRCWKIPRPIIEGYVMPKAEKGEEL